MQNSKCKTHSRSRGRRVQPRFAFRIGILHYRDRRLMDRRSFIKLTAISGHERGARQLRQSGEHAHPLRPGRGHRPRSGGVEAERVPAVRRGLRAHRARDGRRRRRRPRRTGGRRADPRGEEARRQPDASGQPRRALRARSGGDSGDLPPRSHHAAAQAQRRSRRAATTRPSPGTRRSRSWCRGSTRSTTAGTQKTLACLTRSRGHRAALLDMFLARFGAPAPSLRAVRRRRAAPRQRAQLRPRAAADVRPAERAARDRLWRRLPRHLEFAGVERAGLRRDAPGPRRHPRLVRAGRVAHVADRRQRRRMGAGPAGDRRRAGARARARHHARQAAAGERRVARGRRSRAGVRASPTTRPSRSRSSPA